MLSSTIRGELLKILPYFKCIVNQFFLSSDNEVSYSLFKFWHQISAIVIGLHTIAHLNKTNDTEV